MAIMDPMSKHKGKVGESERGAVTLKVRGWGLGGDWWVSERVL